MTDTLKSPYPYFGGKRLVAAAVWERFGKVSNYVEPFFGSGAVLLSNPAAENTLETVNDACAYLTNFWRALTADADAVAHWADYPVSELDLHARHRWLVCGPESDAFRENMRCDPDFYDVKFAGWWVWGISQWIGSGWCCRTGAEVEKLPHLSDGGRGLHRVSLSEKRPHLAHKGKGICRVSLKQQIPHVGNAGQGVNRASLTETGLLPYLETLAARTRRVRVCCGDWSRICGPSVTIKNGLTGVFLDPPYGSDRADLYAVESRTVAGDALKWAIEQGNDPLMRIAVCGYDDEFINVPNGWKLYSWEAQGGYGLQGEGRGRKNRKREAILFSPHCLNRAQPAQEIMPL